MNDWGFQNKKFKKGLKRKIKAMLISRKYIKYFINIVTTSYLMSCTTTNFIQSKPSPFVYQARQREQERKAENRRI